MASYEYGNTRLHAMKSRLLSKEILESLAVAESVETLITGLTKTSYSKAVEAALARVSGMAVITEALRQDLSETVGKVHQYYEGTAAQSVALLLRVYDVQNLKAVLRGLSQHLTADEIMGAVLAVGEIPESVWILLARADGPRGAIDYLATLGQPFAQPLLELRAQKPGASTADMELSIEQWYFNQASGYIKSSSQAPHGLIHALKLEADLINLLTVLRFAYAPAERKRLDGDGLQSLLVGPGELSFRVLESAGEQDTLEEAVALLTGSPYTTALEAGMNDFLSSRRLSDFEFQLRLHRLRWMRNQILLDPLGIGVPVGYLALKTSEISNLRWIVHGIHQEFGRRAILAGLEFCE
jgi:vacuolar-type H+-ATPase subunit C/Vma6